MNIGDDDPIPHFRVIWRDANEPSGYDERSGRIVEADARDGIWVDAGDGPHLVPWRDVNTIQWIGNE